MADESLKIKLELEGASAVKAGLDGVRNAADELEDALGDVTDAAENGAGGLDGVADSAGDARDSFADLRGNADDASDSLGEMGESAGEAGSAIDKLSTAAGRFSGGGGSAFVRVLDAIFSAAKRAFQAVREFNEEVARRHGIATGLQDDLAKALGHTEEAYFEGRTSKMTRDELEAELGRKRDERKDNRDAIRLAISAFESDGMGAADLWGKIGKGAAQGLIESVLKQSGNGTWQQMERSSNVFGLVSEVTNSETWGDMSDEEKQKAVVDRLKAEIGKVETWTKEIETLEKRISDYDESKKQLDRESILAAARPEEREGLRSAFLSQDINELEQRREKNGKLSAADELKLQDLRNQRAQWGSDGMVELEKTLAKDRDAREKVAAKAEAQAEKEARPIPRGGVEATDEATAEAGREKARREYDVASAKTPMQALLVRKKQAEEDLKSASGTEAVYKAKARLLEIEKQITAERDRQRKKIDDAKNAQEDLRRRMEDWQAEKAGPEAVRDLAAKRLEAAKKAPDASTTAGQERIFEAAMALDKAQADLADGTEEAKPLTGRQKWRRAQNAWFKPETADRDKVLGYVSEAEFRRKQGWLVSEKSADTGKGSATDGVEKKQQTTNDLLAGILKSLQ